MKKIKMIKDGEWIEWDGSDVSQLVIEETVTLRELIKMYPERKDEIIKRLEDK